MRKSLVLVLVLIALAALAVSQRHRLLLRLVAEDGPPALLEAADEGPGVRWVVVWGIFFEQCLQLHRSLLGIQGWRKPEA